MLIMKSADWLLIARPILLVCISLADIGVTLYQKVGYHLSLHFPFHFLTLFLFHPRPVWVRGTPLPPLSIYFLIFSPFYFFLSFLGFIYFLILSIPSLSTRIVPLSFQAGGRRRRPNVDLVCLFFCFFLLSVFLTLDVFWCFVVFGLVYYVCVPSVLWHR